MKKAAVKIILNIVVIVLILGGLWGARQLISTRNQRLQREADGVSNSKMTESEYLAQQSSEKENENLNTAKESEMESSVDENAEESTETSETNGFTRFIPEKNERYEQEYDGFYELGDTIELQIDNGEGTIKLTVTECQVITKDEEGLDPKKFQKIDGQPVWAATYEDGTKQRYVYPQFVQEDGSFLEGISILMVRVRVENVNARLNDRRIVSAGGEYNFSAKSLFQMVSSKWHRPTYDSLWYRIQQEPCYFSEMNGVFSDSKGDHAWIFTLEPGESTEFVLGFYLSDERARGEEKLSEIRLVTYDTINGHGYQYLINPCLE